MRYLTVVSLCAVAVLSGCASSKTLQATGGSRSDGTVNMSYEYSMFEKPQPDWLDAEQKAENRCSAWGYDDAEKFGGQTSVCQQSGELGCQRTLVTAKYQCVNDEEQESGAL